MQPASFPRWRNHNPREGRVSCGGQEIGSERLATCTESQTGRRAPGFWCSCHIPARNLAGLLRPEGVCLAGLQGEGWWMGALTKSGSQPLDFPSASGQTAIPPPPASIHMFTFLAMIHTSGDFNRVQSGRREATRWLWGEGRVS